MLSLSIQRKGLSESPKRSEDDFLKPTVTKLELARDSVTVALNQCHQLKEFFINRLKKAANAAKAGSHRREPVVTSKSIMSRDNGDRIEHLEFLSPLSRLHV